jgi:hypothetical protein
VHTHGSGPSRLTRALSPSHPVSHLPLTHTHRYTEDGYPLAVFAESGDAADARWRGSAHSQRTVPQWRESLRTFLEQVRPRPATPLLTLSHPRSPSLTLSLSLTLTHGARVVQMASRAAADSYQAHTAALRRALIAQLLVS